MSGGSPLASSLTDMMTSLMVVFVLLLVTTLKDVSEQKVEAERQRAEASRADAIAQQRKNRIQEAWKRDRHGADDVHSRFLILQRSLPGVSVFQDPTDPFLIVVVIPEKELDFKFGDHKLSPVAETILRSFGSMFMPILHAPDTLPLIEAITVEGHADRRQKISFANLEISQKRSFEVMKFLLEEFRASFPHFDELSSVSGRGDKECTVGSESSDDEQAKCRSVKFKVRIKRSETQRFIDEVTREGLEVGDGV